MTTINPFHYFSVMWNLIKTELKHLSKESEHIDVKIITIFLSSTILFTISWYYSNPKYLSQLFTFHKSFDLVYEDLAAFSAWFILDIILFFVIPLIIIKVFFRNKISEYGCNIKSRRLGFTVFLVSTVLFIPIIYFISFSESFTNYFPLMQSATDELLVFIAYELLFVLFLYAWEFIFRGFMLFGLEKKFGLYAIFIQMIPFVLLHNGKPFPETFAAIFGGLFLGYLAIRTRSIFYGFLIHSFILISLDILAYLRV